MESPLYASWGARSGLLVNHHGGPHPDLLVGERHGEYPVVQDIINNYGDDDMNDTTRDSKKKGR